MNRFTFSLLLSAATLSSFSQIDTTDINTKVNRLKTLEDHKAYLSEIYESDQSHRGKNTDDALDKLNLIKSCIYFNRFGHPSKEKIGRPAGALRIVWIHIKYPQVDKYTFPMIMEGYKAKEITEEDFREYYFNSIYSNEFSDKDHHTKPIGELLKKLKPNIKRPINISRVLELFKEEENFLKEKRNIIGMWQRETKYDTLPFNNDVIVNEIIYDPVQLFRDTNSDTYFYNLYSDGSGYPEKLTPSTKSKNRYYKYSEASGIYLEVMGDGTLKMQSGDDSIILNPLE